MLVPEPAACSLNDHKEEWSVAGAVKDQPF